MSDARRGQQADDWDKETPQEVKKRLQSLPAIEWWMWRATGDTAAGEQLRASRISTVMGDLWLVGTNLTARAKEAIREVTTKEELPDNIELHEREHSVGRMFSVRFEAWGRGGQKIWQLTPPIYRFCDLDKVVPDVGAEIAPYDFWVQPTVLEESSETMHGAPWKQEVYGRQRDAGSRPRQLVSLIQHESAYKVELEIVQVALDAWIERYERSGETRYEGKCAAVTQRGDCTNASEYKMGLPTMQSTVPVCAKHVDEMARAGFHVVDRVKR